MTDTSIDVDGRSVRSERHRYTRWNGAHPDEELYDHSNDPREFTNLARKPEHRAALDRMRATLDAGWRAARAKL
jgi:uncharacterized sulfatase